MSSKKTCCLTDGAEKTKCAIRCVESSMKRNKLTLDDIMDAVKFLYKKRLVGYILSCKTRGDSIRKIARAVHMDDKRVSAILKSFAPAVGKSKPAKPCTCRNKKR